jgi:uncharacterized protein (TIGR02996 family)
MTHDERSLLAAIRDDPDDDTARLVYADWLEENGRADHAELIRVQIALAREQGDAKALEHREEELLERLRAAWPEGLAEAGVIYRRGMGVLTWDGIEEFHEGAARLAAAGPPPWLVEYELEVQAYRLNDSHSRQLVESPSFARITRLEITNGERLTAATIRAIGNSPYAANLRSIELQGVNLGGLDAAALAEASLRRLRRLALLRCPLGAEPIERLANCTTLEELRELVLLWCVEDPSSIIALAKANGLPRLRSLCLTNNKIGDARLRLLLASPLLARLSELILAGNAIRDNGAKALADCEALAGLKSLNLNSNQLSDAGVQALLDSPHLAGLEELDLQWQKKISESMLERVRKRLAQRKKAGP